MTKSRGGGVFEVLGRCSFRVRTPGYAEVTFTIDFEIFSISQVSQVVHVNFTSVHSVATSNTTIGHIWFLARTTIKLVLFFIRSTRTMMDFSQKLHRTETLSYRGWNHTFEAFTLPTKPKNQYQNKTLEWDTLRTYSPVWTLTFLINTMYVTILPISFFFIQRKQKLGIGETRLYPTFAFKELSKPSPLSLSQ